VGWRWLGTGPGLIFCRADLPERQWVLSSIWRWSSGTV